jgi:hypothetical protein
MKRTIIVLLMLIPLLSIAVDPAPPHVTFKLNDNLKFKLAYITLVDSLSGNDDPYHDKIVFINSDQDEYYFYFRRNDFKIMLKFKDSTEVYPPAIHKNDRYSKYYISLDSKQKLIITEKTEVENASLAEFLFFAFLCFLLLKIFLAWIFLFPKDIKQFLKAYGILQLIYITVATILVILLKGAGVLLTILVLMGALISDYYILKQNYFGSKGKRRIIVLLVVTAVFTMLFLLIFSIMSLILFMK